MQPTEDVFHLKEDPYELVNLAGNPRIRWRQNRLREAYDQALDSLRDAVDPGGPYAKYGDLFRRKNP
jgi:hypothetical protein